MVDPVVSYIGVESGNLISHKRFLALFAGGMLPLISLSFLHMLVKFEEEGKKNKSQEIDIDELSKKAGLVEKELVEEKITPMDEDLEKLEKVINEIERAKTQSEVLVDEPVEETVEDPTKVNRLVYTKQ